MKVTQYIAKFLKSKGIYTIFELQGGMITRIIDAFYQEGGIEIISMHHEQAAAMAADAYGRVANKPGVALATSGPGATNLLTGIANCFFDSVPAIFITGQVNTNEQKGEKLTRQLGFQETDIVAMAKPITKKTYAIKTKDEIATIFEEAFQISISGRPGPVLIDIPMNIQNQEIEDTSIIEKPFLKKNSTTYDDFINKYIDVLKSSKRPLLLIGRGIRAGKATDLFKKFITKFKIPVVSSLLGIDVLPYNHPLRVGLIGTYGNRWANYALGCSDVLLVLGSRIDLRQTGADIDTFKQGKQIFHIDIDSAELNNRITGSITLNADLTTFFEHILEINYFYSSPIDWNTEINEKRKIYKDTLELKNIKDINPNIFMHQLSKASYNAKTFTTDVGNNQMWSAQSLELQEGQLFLSSGGMGAMGYALPAAIGASVTLKKPVVCISGDGGFQINIQELETIKRNNLPIKIVILNNHCLGMIRQFQDSYFNSRYQSTVWGYSAPDFTKIAQAYGIENFSIEKEEDVNMGLDRMWRNTNSPFLLNVNIDIHTNVYPKMLFGSPLTQMEPTIE